MLLEQRKDLLARGGGVAADDVDEALLGEHPPRRGGIVGVASARIVIDRLQAEREAVVRIDLPDGQQSAVAHGSAKGPVRAGHREQKADPQCAAFAHARTPGRNAYRARRLAPGASLPPKTTICDFDPRRTRPLRGPEGSSAAPA